MVGTQAKYHDLLNADVQICIFSISTMIDLKKSFTNQNMLSTYVILSDQRFRI